MTPFAAHLRQIIAREGPISVARYMAECLGHPEHGYYMTRDPLGRAGDFTTAPEIHLSPIIEMLLRQRELDVNRIQ